MTAEAAGGALPQIATIVTRLAGRAGQAADRASDLARQADADLAALLLALGGGPPADLRTSQAQVAASVAALGEAAAALKDAATALGAFATRST